MSDVRSIYAKGVPKWRRDDSLRNPLGCALHSAPTAGSPWSRWSYAPYRPRAELRCDAAGRPALTTGPAIVREWADPLDALQWLAAPGDARVAMPTRHGPPFTGGWVGYLGYDLGRRFEEVPARATDDLRLPLFAFTYFEAAIAEDHATGRRYDVRRPSDFESTALPPAVFPVPVAGSPSDLRSTFSRPGYEAAVRRAKEYIAAGDVFQVNLAQRFTATLPASPEKVYNRLQQAHPASYAAYLGFADHALISNSPELFFRVELLPDGRRRIVNRPIKGTRPRLPGMDEELRRSEKDQAELTMIVDLQRNDLGRICEVGSVRVTEPRVIEAHPTVYHGVATIEGVLRPDVGFVDILRAVFPCGSVTGCPKIRAMQIIDGLEPVRRGPYCGAIGWIGPGGAMEFNVAIRTMIVKDGLVHIPVGGGIVADSDPAAEYEETLVKATAMLAALGVSADDVRAG